MVGFAAVLIATWELLFVCVNVFFSPEEASRAEE